MIFLGAGLAVARARGTGIAATVVLCAIGVVAVVSVATTYAFQRPNWQSLADLLGPWPAHGTHGSRIVVIQDNPGGMPLGLYFDDMRYIGTPAIDGVTAIDVIAIADTHTHEGFCWWGSACNLVPSRLDRDYRIPGFRVVARRRVRQFRVLELRAARPTTVQRSALPTASPSEHRHFVRSGTAGLQDAQLLQQG